MVEVVDLGYLPTYSETSRIFNITSVDGAVRFKAQIGYGDTPYVTVEPRIMIDGAWISANPISLPLPTSGIVEFDFYFPVLSLGTHSVSGTIAFITWYHDPTGQSFSMTSTAKLAGSTITFVEAVQKYNLAVTATEGGTTDPAPNTYSLDAQTQITVRAIPYVGYVFDYWLLDSQTVYTSEITVTMDRDFSAVAYFKLGEVVPPTLPSDSTLVIAGVASAIFIVVVSTLGYLYFQGVI